MKKQNQICTCGHSRGNHSHSAKKSSGYCRIKGCPCKKFEPQMTIGEAAEELMKLPAGTTITKTITPQNQDVGRVKTDYENWGKEKPEFLPGGKKPPIFNLSKERRYAFATEKEIKEYPTMHGVCYPEDKVKEYIKGSLEEIKTNPRIVNENDLQKMEYIELSYTGELIPVEEVEFILMWRAGDDLNE